MAAVRTEDIKKAVGYAAIDRFAKSGMKIGIGTGSTALWAVRRLAERLDRGELTNIVVIPTSIAAEIQGQELGLRICSLNDPVINGQVDFAFDGADEISPEAYLIKGAGAAMLGEKLVAQSADQFVVIADATKVVGSLGIKFPVPVEVVPVARLQVSKVLERMGASVTVREGSGKIGPVITDYGHIILDAHFAGGLKSAKITHPQALEQAIKAIPGVVELGLFSCPVHNVLVGYPDGQVSELPLKAR